MSHRMNKLAYQGNWDGLLRILRQAPEFIDSASDGKSYTALHQAAWHGASLEVVGELLSLGANRELKTSKGQTPADIALEQHPERADLNYILTPARRSLAQLLRKVQAENPDFFGTYDGNQVVLDRLIEFASSDFCHSSFEYVGSRLNRAFQAVTGIPLAATREAAFLVGKFYEFAIDPAFWRNRFLPALLVLDAEAHVIPIEQDWAVMSDLFDPVPEQWGLRGDLFLWMEMRQALCHVEIPGDSEGLTRTISAAFASLTGEPLEHNCQVAVKRLSRGGMSSGLVCGEFWSGRFIPLLQQRADWLKESWRARKSLEL